MKQFENKNLKNYISTIINVYANMSAPAKASIWFVICNILQKGISFLTIPIFTRIMSTEEYGLYTVYNSWYSLIMVFATLNLFYGVYNNGMTKFQEKKDEMTSSMLGLCSLTTIVLFLIYSMNRSFWNNIFSLSTFLVVVMFIQFLTFAPVEFWMVRMRYEYKYKSVVLFTLLTTVMSMLLSIVFVMLSTEKAVARIISFAIINAIAGIIIYINILIKGKCLYSKFFWIYSLKFNIPLVPHYLSSQILNQADRIMIGEMIGKGEAAIYSIAYSIAMLMNIISSAITNAFTPYTYQCLKKCSYKELRQTGNVLALVAVAICIIIESFAPEIIKIIAPEEYYDAIWVVPPIVASAYFIFLYPFFSNIEFYYEKTKFIMFASCISAISNIFLNYIFISKIGYIAAGYTTLFCYVIYAFAHYVFSLKILKKNGVNKIYDGKFIFSLSIFLCSISLFNIYIYGNIILRYFIVIILLSILFRFRSRIYKYIRRMK